MSDSTLLVTDSHATVPNELRANSASLPVQSLNLRKTISSEMYISTRKSPLNRKSSAAGIVIGIRIWTPSQDPRCGSGQYVIQTP